VALTHDEAFLADIVENAADDAPRLVYADWLDDHGEPGRAEFIRVQCERNRLPGSDDHQRYLMRREDDLLACHEDAWRAELPRLEGVTWEHFTRGFVEAVFVETVGQFLAHAPVLFAAAPVRRLQVGRLDPGDARRLARSPHLARLTELNLGNDTGLDAGGVRALAGSPYLANLSALLLHYNDLGDEAVVALAGSPHLARLAELYLSGTGLGDAGVIALARSPYLGRLTDLDLRDNTVGDAGATALAGARRLGALTTLYLVNNRVGPAGAAALARAPVVMPRLARLYINYNPVENDGACALAGSPHVVGLRDLDLRHCGIRDRGALALAGSPSLEGLELLWLGGNRIRVETLNRIRRRFGERLRL
jgi:uncharacterized protein (TIGR02996 family)